MSEIKFNRQSSPVFDRLYQDAKDREKLKDPFALVKREDILEHSMLFEGNSDEEIEYDPNDDGIKRV